MHEDLPWTRPHVAEELLGGVRANFAAKVRHDVVEFAMRTTKAARAAFVSEQPAALAAIATNATIAESRLTKRPTMSAPRVAGE